jgi:hypothetical protein
MNPSRPCYPRSRKSPYWLSQKRLVAPEISADRGNQGRRGVNAVVTQTPHGEVTEGRVPQALFADARNREARERTAPAFTGEAVQLSPPSATSTHERNE